MTQQPTRICILGGGFGGLYTALRLSQFPWQKSEKPDIVLVDQRDRFLFLPLLYELITGELQSWEIAPPFAELLANTEVQFCQGVIAGVDLHEKRVQLQEGMEFSYDQLVLALGGETPLEQVRGAAEYGYPFHSLTHAYRLQERLRILEASDAEKIRVAVVGAGYSGVELACKLAERLGSRGRVRLIEQGDEILRNSSDFNRQAANKALSERGVWIDLETSVAALGSDHISLVYKGQEDTIPVDIILWTVGNQVSPVIKSLPLKQNQRGQLAITPTLQTVDAAEIFALGDIVQCQDADGQTVPTTAQSALQQADYVAWNIWASCTGRPLLPFRYQPLGEMITLGVDNATLTGLGIQLDGQLAHLVRRLVYLYRMPTLDHQIKLAFNWMSQPFQTLLSQLEL